MKSDRLSFTEQELQSLFGHEAAEDEDPKRLRDYYFRTEIYEQAMTDMPLRILVAHKGVGKSAMFQVGIQEDFDRGRLPILIKPDDIVGLATDTSDFLRTVREWKRGLTEIIASKVLTSFGSDDDGWPDRLAKAGGRVVDFLHTTLKSCHKADLGNSERAVVNGFLKDRIITVYIDDLDRGWQGRGEDILRVSALLNAVRDLPRENKGLQFRISLRSDVYYLVRTSDESTDKIENSVIWLSWTNHQIFVLLVKRIETFFGRPIGDSALATMEQRDLKRYLDPIMEPRFMGAGHWQNAPIHKVLMSLIRKRPRDLVKLCTQAAREARSCKSSRIATKHFESIFEQYSQGRLQDTINEFRSELPEVERLITNMKPSRRERTAKEGYCYKTEDLLRKIATITERGEFRFRNGRIATARDLAAFMYKINFLTARKEVGDEIKRVYFEENRYLQSSIADFGFDWEIHPAYRWALQPDDPLGVFDLRI